MSSEIVNEIHKIVDDIYRLVIQLKTIHDDSKRFEIMSEISRKHARLQMLIAQLLTL